VIGTAYWKLTNGEHFDPQNKHHVFAVLSQRICLEPVLTSSEALALADESVANHMRLLTGISPDRRMFHTYSPSEPILALGAIRILYKKPNLWAPILDTFSKQLCQSGLVDKGLMGEFAARTLLLIARDFTAPEQDGGRDLLRPVPLMNFLDRLFGNTPWCGSDRERFETAFAGMYINFMHWMVTKDPLPEVPDPSVDCYGLIYIR
jgi:hypothetical protein